MRSLIIAVLATLIVGCSARTSPKVAKTAAPAAIAAPSAESRPAAVRAAIPSDLPERSAPDVIAADIAAARNHFERGSQLLDKGEPKQAKTEFDIAVDILVESSTYNPGNARLRSELNELVARINALEIAALRDEPDPKADHAAIDDLEHIPTFPAPIDPKLKQAVEAEVRRSTHDLPIEINDRVLSFLQYYQNGKGRNTMTVGLERLGHYREMMEQILMQEDVPLDLVYLAQAESAFLPRALSRAKAKGLWQFISARGKEYGLRQTFWLDERSDPEKATRAAARHLRDLYEEFGDWYLAMAAYNSGPFRVESALRKTGATSFWELADRKALPRETINYVPTILALAIIGRNPDKYGFDGVVPSPSRAVERMAIADATDLRVIANSIGVPVETLKDLNPQLLRWTTPPNDSEFELILPKGYGEKFAVAMASLPANERILFQYHIVKKGDTLSAIAKRYGVGITEITQANNMSVKRTLSIGQELQIPMSGVAPAAARATARVVTAAPAAAPATSYVVKRGDTLSKIAGQFGISVNQLKAWNRLTSTRIDVGMRLVVADPAQPSEAPQRVVHNVRQGETLNQIASTYKTTVDAILAWNKTDDLTVIHPGDQITIFLGN